MEAPSAVVNGAFPLGAGSAWTLAGRPVPPGPIPVALISGPVLAIAGADDMLWQSPTWTTQIDDELGQAHVRFPHAALIYPHAGHGVGSFPYLATATRVVHPITGEQSDLGAPEPVTKRHNKPDGRPYSPCSPRPRGNREQLRAGLTLTVRQGSSLVP
ncbi:MAG TPA: acyl-CoA thioester hydrolase/BAAT C-terminal domain-containing protein [Pseudonocardiaceae bacterium]|nr:acyl-CoA thioester hydrolase/BAAT C-terminal domain-containing protein [Pseudonocardiaceae bacterium]